MCTTINTVQSASRGFWYLAILHLHLHEECLSPLRFLRLIPAWDFRIWVWGLGFRFPGFGFRIWDGISCFELRFLDFRLQVSSLGVSGFGSRIPGFRVPSSVFREQIGRPAGAPGGCDAAPSSTLTTLIAWIYI